MKRGLKRERERKRRKLESNQSRHVCIQTVTDKKKEEAKLRKAKAAEALLLQIL